MRASIRETTILTISLVLIVSMFPPFELIDYAYWALATSFNVAPEVFIMISDLLLLFAGVLLAYSLQTILSARLVVSDSGWMHNSLINSSVPSLTAAVLVIVYWHIPFVLDSSLLNYGLHVIMHLSLLGSGILIFIGGRRLSRKMQKISTILGCKAMGIFGVYLLVTSGSGYNSFYSFYPIDQQAQLGLAMIVMMFVFDGFEIPYWLFRYFTSPMPS